MEKTIAEYSKALVLLVAAAALSACSVSASGGEEIPLPIPTPAANAEQTFEKPAIPGPDVAGKWISSCVKNYFTDGTRKLTVQYEKSKFTYTKEEFSDQSCTTISNTEQFGGPYQFSQQNPDNEWVIDYNYKIGNVIYHLSGQKLQLEGDTLYLSEFAFGTVKVNRDMPFKKEGATPTPPVSSAPNTGGLKKAKIANNFSNAKYAFCNTQGFGVMVDFQGKNLTEPGIGKAKIGYKSCESREAIQWSSKTLDFQVTMSGNSPKVSFLYTTSDSYIEPYGTYQSGLSSSIGAIANINGNSGSCFFLENDGTQDIPFTYPCF